MLKERLKPLIMGEFFTPEKLREICVGNFYYPNIHRRFVRETRNYIRSIIVNEIANDPSTWAYYREMGCKFSPIYDSSGTVLHEQPMVSSVLQYASPVVDELIEELYSNDCDKRSAFKEFYDKSCDTKDTGTEKQKTPAEVAVAPSMWAEPAANTPHTYTFTQPTLRAQGMSEMVLAMADGANDLESTQNTEDLNF